MLLVAYIKPYTYRPALDLTRIHFRPAYPANTVHSIEKTVSFKGFKTHVVTIFQRENHNLATENSWRQRDRMWLRLQKRAFQLLSPLNISVHLQS